MAGSIVQSAYAVDDSSASATTIAVAINGVVAGNHLVAHTGWSDAGTTTCTVNDGTAYTSGAPKVRDTTNSESGQVDYKENSGSGNFTVTSTFSVTKPFRRIRVYEVSGLQKSSSLDQATGQFQATPGTGANGVSSGATSATTNANDFVMGFSQDTAETDPGTGTVTAGTGFSISGTNVILSAESKSVTSTGTQTATFTQSVGNARVTHVTAFKELSSSSFNKSSRFPVNRVPLVIGTPTRLTIPSVFKQGLSASTDLTLALTGVSSTSSVGNVGVSFSLPLTGVSETSSVGTVTSNFGIPLTGFSSSGSVGNISPNFSLQTTNVLGTFSVGNVSVNFNVPITGVQSQGQVGNVGVAGDLTLAITGVESQGQVGNISSAVTSSDSFSGGYLRDEGYGKYHPYVYKPRRRYQLPNFPEPVKEVIQDIVKRVDETKTEEPLTKRDLEIALRLRLRLLGIVYQQEYHKALKSWLEEISIQKQDEELFAVTLLLM